MGPNGLYLMREAIKSHQRSSRGNRGSEWVVPQAERLEGGEGGGARGPAGRVS